VPLGHPATRRAHGDSEQWLAAAHSADSARRPGRLSGVTGGMQIIIYAQP
jgi:hypothetical protein